MSPHPVQPNTFGINLYGYLTANLGLGVAARNTAEMLLKQGVPLRLIDVNPGGGMQGHDTTFVERIASSRTQEPYGINLFHINPDQILYLLGPRGDVDLSCNRLNVCVPFWELPRLPESWHDLLSGMDAILAPTHFIEQAVRADLTDARVVHYPQAVHLPGGIVQNPSAFGLPDSGFVFVMSFDMRSDIERKNPWAAIDAFLRAFPDRGDVRLVIKANNVDTIAGLDRQIRRLREVAADSRVLIIDRHMSYHEVLSLYASCDALVSLHRAEGLGLSLLEAMALGMPVIATGWSGNMDFMTDENSCLVGYDMVDVVSSTQPAYGKSVSGTQQWAEPRVKEAAAWMRRLAENPEFAATVGARAKNDISALITRYDEGGPALAALRDLADETARQPSRRAAAQRHLARMRSLYPVNQTKRIIRAALHRLRTKAGL